MAHTELKYMIRIAQSSEICNRGSGINDASAVQLFWPVLAGLVGEISYCATLYPACS